MRQSLISVPIFFGSWIQSCTKLVGTHALLIIITFIIKMYVYKMTCMIQYPCSKHASSPSLPHQAMLVYICFLFIRSALSLTTLILGSGEQSFYYKVSQQFRTRLWFIRIEIKKSVAISYIIQPVLLVSNWLCKKEEFVPNRIKCNSYLVGMV